MTIADWVRGARKFAVAVAAALGVAATLVADGSLSSSDWIAIALAFAGAIGVYRVPNADV